MEKLDLPDWMSQLPTELHSVPLRDLAIPGSHHTMTYCLDGSSDLEPNASELLKILKKVFGHFVDDIVERWATTQELNIIQQLDAGVRYFDLRIACKPNDVTHILYFAHALYTTVTVEETFNKVHQWLAGHPKEVIILACSTFDGVDVSDHQSFIAQLIQLFGKKLCPKMARPSLQHCWDHGYQVILSYAHSAASGHQELWPEIDYWWSDQDRTSASKVIQYLDDRLKGKGQDDTLFMSGLNLTPNSDYVAANVLSSIKEMTLAAYPELLAWVKRQHCGQGKGCINIIAADFVGVNQFVQLVIEINRKK
ncbi:PI-PLC X domain-containing protein 1-like [Alosa alosa]|uniref:PI-PLC X domain-containing protein 1-like n=1 Tax=Alosa alosa TaxID=278164 RepID=UPI0020154B2A|nr:PI-PLC X domain-containing protein 1-like [Alosa alosa]